MLELLGLPVNGAAHGGEIDNMIVLVHWLMLVLFVGWGLYFIYVLFRFRAGRQKQAVYEGTKTKVSTWIEGAVAVIEGVLLLAFAIPAWASRVADFPPEHEAEVIRVVAQQFAWNVHYPGADGMFGPTDPHRVGPTNPVGLDRDDPTAKDDVVMINQMRLPVDKPAIIHLSTLDVIHSFGLPQMRVKQDAIPGMSIPLWFTPTMLTPEGETWHIACAQLCGNSHYSMRGFYKVLEQADFDAWLAANAPKPPPVPEPEPEPAADEAAEGEAA